MVRSRSDALPPVSWRSAGIAAASSFAVLIIFAGRYGYHRDELYFLACAKRLAWGFVDQPPLTPAIARLSQAIAPGSLVVLRLWPALFMSITIVLTVLTARELGAGRVGQAAVAAATALCPGIYAAGHLLSTTTPDILLWVALTLLVVRILRTENVRLWPAAGLLIGIALLNKWTIGFLVAGLLLGIAVGPERRLLANRWFAAGVGIGFVLWLPNLWWQGAHGWPQLRMFVDIRSSNSGLGPTIAWLPLQFAITGYLAAALWIPGLSRVLRPGEGRPYRALGIAYVSLAVLLAIAVGDKPYYVAALYFPLMAAGAVPFERWWTRNAGRARRMVVPALLGVLTLVGMPIVLPILPASTLADVPLQDINYDLGEQIGWQTIVRQVGEAWVALPAADRAHAVILTSNYGEAGAIERYGTDLPTPYSGHNSYWWWGTPPADTATVLAVGEFDGAYLKSFFASVERVGTLDNGLGMENEEKGQGIWVCRGPRASLPELWPDLRHYD
jgi:4-amino-4-deoxy-L-arabinose transferase-like glycosyltransferase